jgi:ketosteroid isomerase-like protein
LCTLALALILYSAGAQSQNETEIRTLDSAQKEAYFKKDTLALFKLFSPKVIVHGPYNKIETLEDLLVRIRAGGSKRETYDRVVEKVTFVGNIAMVMGNETTKPTGIAENAGKTVKRRFTNVWQKNSTSWLWWHASQQLSLLSDCYTVHLITYWASIH